MNALLLLAAKSLIIAGAALLILRLMRERSAAERSWIAHLGLFALVLLPIAPLVIPTFAFEAQIMGQTPAPLPTATGPLIESKAVAVATPSVGIETETPALSVTDIIAAAYWLPAAILLGITLIALGRLLALRARAEVLVDTRWLGALARAQKRMGFKHGTALLTSDDLPSPISWGLMRPVILLNTKAVEAAGEAEAIIAHELAHVARLDWIKLLLARVATAMFWFNPLAWMLAREAHQLREEAADDSVLAADIADTDYADLLVGIARHECKGLLIGAHGVAPSKGSLARRVSRVLDAGLARGPVAGSFALGVFVGTAALAAPLAAVTLVPTGSKQVAATTSNQASPFDDRSYHSANPTRELANVIGRSVSASVTGVVASVNGISIDIARDAENRAEQAIEDRARLIERDAENPLGRASAHIGPHGQVERKSGGKAPDQAIARKAGGGVTREFVGQMRQVLPHVEDDDLIGLRAVGATPEFVVQMRQVLPRVAGDDLIGLRAVGVTPQFVREMAAAGYADVDPDDLVGARAVGVTGEYARSLAAAGYPRVDLDDLTAMRAVGVTPETIVAARRAGLGRLDPEDLVAFKAVGFLPSDPSSKR